MRKSLRYLLLLPVFSIMLVNCDDDETEAVKPIQVETKEVISVDYESAVVTGKIIEFGKGVDAYGHCWSTSPIPSIEDDTTVVVEEIGGDFQSAISGLVDGEKYYFRSYALNDEEIVYGEIKEFTTEIHPLKIGLVASYPFNGDANDYSGNENHGTNYDAILTTDRFGNPNSAYNFDGIDDYINVSHSSDFDGIKAISFWFQPFYEINETHNQLAGLINKRIGSPEYAGFHIYIYGNANPAHESNGRMHIANDPGLESVTSISSINRNWNANTWYHVVVNLDGDGIVYVNGQNDTYASTLTNSSFTNSNTPMYFGRYQAWAQDYYNGSLNAVSLFSRALTDDEIQTLYHEGGWDE